MDSAWWESVKETLIFLSSMLSPFLLWFSGKFIYNKWEKKKLLAQSIIDENEAKKKEAELVVIYEGMARRSAEDVIDKSERIKKLEIEYDARLVKMEEEINSLKSENSFLKDQIAVLQENKILINKENENLQRRVAILEQTLIDNNISLPCT